MGYKIFATVFIVIALALAVFAALATQAQLMHLIYVSRFFDIMLPVLAVGALIKYLCCCGKSHCDK